MRTRNSIMNAAAAIVSNLITLIAGYILQIVFVNTLGKEYLGVNGLFSNIIALLGLIELGIGTAIVFHLYKPVANNDEKKIAALNSYYKKCYNIIAMIVAVIGLLIIPVLPFIVGTTTIKINLNLVYALILSEVVLSYLLSYKRSILYVNQKNYIINIFHICYTVILNILCILALWLTKDYILFLIIKCICKILENIAISIYVDKHYQYLKTYKNEKLDILTIKDIKKQVKALFTHKIGGYIINGTDNILISKIFGVVNVGLYSNYYLVTYGATSLLSQIFNSVKASVGNLLVLSDEKKTYDIFKKLNFFNFTIYSLFAICFCLAIQPFISFSYGKDYLFPSLVVFVLTYNFYIQGMRQTPNVFKEAAGVFYEDRYIPIIESLLNIIMSIVLAKHFGIAGIFMGTISSSLLLHLYSYPRFVFIKIFKKQYLEYLFLFLKQCLIFSIMLFSAYFINKIYVFDNVVLEFFKSGVCGIFVCTFFIILLFRKTEEYKYFLDLLKSIKVKRKEKNI